MNLADKIIYLRKQKNWSQEELAEQLGISRQSVSKWESQTSVPDLDKILKLSKIFDVSTDFLLKDDLDLTDFEKPETVFAEEPLEEPRKHLSAEDADTYLDLVAHLAPKIALGVCLCIIGPAFLIGLQCFVPLNGTETSFLTNESASAFGVVLLLLFCAAGVFLLISNGMRLSKYEFFETDPFVLDMGIQEIVADKKTQFESVFRKCIAGGTGLCILSVVPLMLAYGFGAGERMYILCTSILLFLIAFAVTLFVWSGMINGSYDKLLEVGDYTKENKKINKKTGSFPGIYWCIVTAIYLAISFGFDNWEISWIVWPVAGVLFAALHQIIKNIAKNKTE